MKTMHTPISDSLATSALIHILDPSALQKSLISRMVTSQKIETIGHENWEEFRVAYSAKRSFCLVANYELLYPLILTHGAKAPLNNLEVSPRCSANSGHESVIDLPIILYADHPSARDVVQGIRAGAIDFLEKPLCANSLCNAIRLGIKKCLEMREREAENAGFRARAEKLTRRERETMALVLKGHSIKQIAASFGIGLQTAAKHRARLLSKMKVSSDAQLVQLLYARE